MDERSLSALFRRVLLLSLAAPMPLAATACGGRSVGELAQAPDGGPDSGVSDASRAPDSSQCTGQPVVTDANTCTSYVTLPCGPPAGYDGGAFTSQECHDLCGANYFSCFLQSTSPNGGAATLECVSCAIGRRPAGLAALPGESGASEIGAYFARAAYLEAASVDAFEILRDELRLHGAPQRLVREAERAAEDEARHARVVGALAHRFGGEHVAPRVERRGPRSLEEIALENATEGCVRETFGALTATWQARAAKDPKVARAMDRIARDETRHAALAWSVARWAAKKLTPAARVRIAEARRAAARELTREIAARPPRALVDIAGLPSAAQATRMAAEMSRSLWGKA